MRIIIAGAGDVGFHLAKLLAYESHDINIIDMDDDRLQYISSHLDVHTTKGNSTSYKVLEDAQVSKADLLIAVTESETANITTSIIGKHLGAKKTIARVTNTEYIQRKDILDLKEIGIDEVISPESLAAKEIKRLLKENALTDTFDFEKGLLSLVGILIDDESELKDKSLVETAYLNPDHSFITVAILRGEETIIPHGADKFQINDHAYFVCQPDGVDRVLDLAGKQRESIKNVMILGGSKIGIQAARQLSKKYNIKLIEQDREKCFELADMLQNTMIINGDGRDVELLKEEGIDEMDAFIAVTGNSETNMISSLVAKNHKVPKTISLVENMDYIHLSQNIGVDTMINKKLIAASFIFRYIRKGQVLNMTTIHGVDAEILEFEVKEGSKILEAELRNLDFPHSALIGGVIRGGKGITARGNFMFEPKDRVVVLSKPECIRKVEGYFK
ncbi:Trk system potassium transporter TrkA [Reichenbachiella agarivorans]|uniref:Trk system potassium uptake protein TrkA n=1 Tax=Reichenbachiella agarivorans TaxID=2979464 RepID=A0ABY6CTJ0_9BACT|nr:Trk system potassium transporter TrkA [Reichenbachiella agarivorans]UXP33310.1 Trk system potassium transporter TrkA [Reichenbachiella agarivorans]